MVLVGSLSNTLTTNNLQCLTSREWRQQPRRKTKQPANGPRPDGRRKFGSVSQAIVQVLTEAQSDLRVREIQGGVERLLGEPVSRHSIKSQMHHGYLHDPPLFERLARGRYRLIRSGT